jgi:ferrochelatase
MTKPTNHPIVKNGRVGVLIVNLGTPDSLETKRVRAYLAEFLADPRVINIPRVVWLPILYGVILTVRPKKSAAAYAKVWRYEEDESPLRYFTRQQAHKLAERFDNYVVDYAMRYGQPSIASRMSDLQKQGCDRILVVPMYPQYSATTNASVADAVFKVMKKLTWQPALRIAAPWYNHPSYIDALKQQVEGHLAQQEKGYDRILLSFHGLPKQSLTGGDPYYCHCQVTGRLLAEALNKTSDEVMVTFQSRFGPAKWLEPYTADTLAELPAQGVKRLLVLTPGFTADCIETLEEIAIEGAETFKAAGGEYMTVLPCLNDSDEGMAMLEAVVKEELGGW